MRLEPQESEVVRCQIVLLAMLGLLGFLLAFLWRIQVVHSLRYESSQARQSVRRVRISGERGRILDRHTVCLADNKPSYCIALYLEELRQPGKWEKTVAKAETVISNLAAVIGREPEVTREDIWMHIRKRLPLPLLVWRDVDEAALARLAERNDSPDAVDIQVEPVRFYPHGKLAAHVLGYVGRAEVRPDDDDPFDYDLPESAGKKGIEAVMDPVLHGGAGDSVIRIDASGFRREEILRREAEAGGEVLVALDVKIQRLAEDALGDVPGAVVVLDPRNGDVLAMASSPSYDPNSFVPFISEEEWRRLTDNPEKPLVDRAVAGLYPPGSLMKPVVAIAAMENGRAGPETEFNCPGYLAIGESRLKCWNENGHGALRMRKALEQSCNTYFAALGLQSGYDVIYHMAAAMGLGQKTGVATDYEAGGLLPDAAWKRRRLRDGWRDGDTCNVAIGQGPILATPLQMAVVVSTIANGGHVYRPRLVLGTRPKGETDFRMIPPEEVRNLGWSDATLEVVRGGMHDVVESAVGTGHRAKLQGVEMAGKTGTAEYGPKGAGLKRGWTMVYAPFNRPRYAVAMVVDEVESGGVTVAPRLRRLMQGIFGVPTGKEAE